MALLLELEPLLPLDEEELDRGSFEEEEEEGLAEDEEEEEEGLAPEEEEPALGSDGIREKGRTGRAERRPRKARTRRRTERGSRKGLGLGDEVTGRGWGM